MFMPKISKIVTTQVKPWFVYLLCCADRSLYCGISTNIEKRLEMHNGLRPGGAKYTKGRTPVELVASLECRSRTEASGFEYKIKQKPKHKKIAFMKSLHEEFNLPLELNNSTEYK